MDLGVPKSWFLVPFGRHFGIQVWRPFSKTLPKPWIWRAPGEPFWAPTLKPFGQPKWEAIFQNLSKTMDLESSRGAILGIKMEAIWAPTMGTILRPDARVRGDLSQGCRYCQYRHPSPPPSIEGLKVGSLALKSHTPWYPVNRVGGYIHKHIKFPIDRF